MIPSPSSSPRPIFHNRTNFNEAGRLPTKHQQKLSFALPTPPKCTSLKRSVQEPSCPRNQKRSKPLEDEKDICEEGGLADVPFRRERIRGTTRSQGYLAIPTGNRPYDVSTQHILESFVSSNKYDVYKCQSAGIDCHLTPPYSCSYSHASRRGESSLLAVSTEQGTIHIINTARKDPWDPEPLRTTIQAHDNGVFDVEWDASDTRLATASADQSARIVCLSTNTVLHSLRGHTSTVKSISWDPSNPALLSTGGKDGSICFWDLRVGEGRISESLPPILSIHGAHEERTPLKSNKRRKSTSSTKTITSLIYSDTSPHNLISSSSYNGVLRCWDVRSLTNSKKKMPKYKLQQPLFASSEDPTSFHGSRRPRGIISLVEGLGPTAGLFFGLGADSRVHIYTRSSLSPMSNSYAHERMQTNSFYTGLATSPCGRWLSSGSTGQGSVFLYDVHNAWRPFAAEEKGVELQGQLGDVGGVAWCNDGLATCADDGTVRMWKPDVDTYHRCLERPDEERWHWSWSVRS